MICLAALVVALGVMLLRTSNHSARWRSLYERTAMHGDDLRRDLDEVTRSRDEFRRICRDAMETRDQALALCESQAAQAISAPSRTPAQVHAWRYTKAVAKA